MVKPNEGARQMQVVLYARVSSERQDVDLSISAQLKALREYAARHGYTVVREFVDEAESAKSADRPKFQEMVALGRRKPAPFQAILVWKLSRFARNREDSILYKSLLRKHGIQVISINEPVEDSPTGRMLEGMIEVIDEFYSANLAQDVLRGMREAASRGYWVSATTPFGYRRIKVHDSGRQRVKLEIEPAAAPIVQRMFRLAASSTGVKDIAKQLNADGIASPKGKRWGKGAVHAMLTSQVYSGVLVWEAASQNPIRVADAIPALVDKAMFDAVQAGLKARSPKIVPPRQVSSPNLLTGLLQCGTCHAAMTCNKNAIGRSDELAHAWIALTTIGLVGGFSIEPTTLKPWRRNNASLAASSLSAATISATSSSRVVVGVQPSFSRACVGSPSRVSTSAGLK